MYFRKYNTTKGVSETSSSRRKGTRAVSRRVSRRIIRPRSASPPARLLDFPPGVDGHDLRLHERGGDGHREREHRVEHVRRRALLPVVGPRRRGGGSRRRQAEPRRLAGPRAIPRKRKRRPLRLRLRDATALRRPRIFCSDSFVSRASRASIARGRPSRASPDPRRPPRAPRRTSAASRGRGRSSGAAPRGSTTKQPRVCTGSGSRTARVRTRGASRRRRGADGDNATSPERDRATVAPAPEEQRRCVGRAGVGRLRRPPGARGLEGLRPPAPTPRRARPRRPLRLGATNEAKDAFASGRGASDDGGAPPPLPTGSGSDDAGRVENRPQPSLRPGSGGGRRVPPRPPRPRPPRNPRPRPLPRLTGLGRPVAPPAGVVAGVEHSAVDPVHPAASTV